MLSQPRLMASYAQQTGAGWRGELLPVTRRLLVLLSIALVSAFVANRLRRAPLPLTAYNPPTQCAEAHVAPAASILSAQATSSLCGRGDVLFADARSEEEFAQGHVTGAAHLACSSSRGDIGQLFENLRDKRTLVVYGNSTEDARRVADGLIRQTPRRDLSIIVLDGGFSAWRDSGLACSSGPCEGCNESSSSHP